MMVQDEFGNYDTTAATEDDILDEARRIIEKRYLRNSDALTSPDMTVKFLQFRLAPLPYEVFSVIFLDNRHRVVAYEEMFRGTIDGATVPPREVVRDALEHNAAAVIFAHNHPSGIAEPSMADERITRRLRDALALINVRVLDHVIVAGFDHVSFAERGLI